MAESAAEKAKQRERNVSGSGSKSLSSKDKKPAALEMIDGAESSKMPATPRQKKLGHRKVDNFGNTLYKKTTSSTLMAAIQHGIQHSVGGLSAKAERDVLLQDFTVVESVFFPGEGSNITPAHSYPDFRFKTYAPVAFRFFRELFGIQPDDFLISCVDRPLRELSNPGASGSVFYLTNDDLFIIKTVQHKEADFLQKLLPGYYMNLNQNPKTLLPKFYGLYTYQSGGRNIRMIIMNNLLPSHLKMHKKFDMKGSTFKRKASKYERTKNSPTLKDLDFIEEYPEGLLLDGLTYNALVKTVQRDCRVLESFKIMDYSLLIGIHNLDQAEREARDGRITPTNNGESSPPPDTPRSLDAETLRDSDDPSGMRPKLERSFSKSRRGAKFNTTAEAIQGQSQTYIPEADEETSGGIPAKNSKGERLLLFIGIIDILQCYKLTKKLEHTYKSFIHDGDTISVHRPEFYAKRFQEFMADKVFKKIPPPKHSPSKRKGQSGFYSQGGGGGSKQRTRTATGDSSKGSASLEKGVEGLEQALEASIGGAKPKATRPDLVPSTPPKVEQDEEEVEAAATGDKQTSDEDVLINSNIVVSKQEKSITVSETAIQTEQVNLPAVLDLQTKLQAMATSETLDLSQRGSSTLDDTNSESSPRKAADLSSDSIHEYEMADLERTPVAEISLNVDSISMSFLKDSSIKEENEQSDSPRSDDAGDEITVEDFSTELKSPEIGEGNEGDSWL